MPMTSRVAGDDHGDHAHHAPKLEEIHEAPLTMLVPLGILALGALFAGAVFDIGLFIGKDPARGLLARAPSPRLPATA